MWVPDLPDCIDVGGTGHRAGMTTLQPPIDVLLHDHFRHLRGDASGVALTRIDIIEQELRDFIELEGHRGLTTGGLAILAAERQFDPRGAFARSMHAADLIFTLPAYIEASGGDHLLRRARLRHIEALAARLIRDGLIDPQDFACPLLDLRAALDRARGELTRMRRQIDHHQQPSTG